MAAFRAFKIGEKVYWVGAIDWAVRDFHGYLTARGTTYNAYLVLAEKVTLIDTVRSGFRDEMLARIASILDPSEIDYIVSNHSEMDHSGCLPEVVDIVKPERVFASTIGCRTLQEHFRKGKLTVEAVSDGGKLSLGDMDLSFLETRMIHWPDSMFSYLAEEQILFSQDGFGMHLASTERFADGIPEWILRHEAAKYYANILLPLGDLIRKLLEKTAGLGIPIKTIAPDHGPIWRENPGWIVDLYSRWTFQESTLKAVVVYDTMWGSTALMARAIADGIGEGGASAVLMPLGSNHRSDVATQILESGALIVGSPTINSGMFPRVADVLSYLRGLKPRNLVGAAFGSYGWSGEAVGQIEGILKEMKVDLVVDSIKAKYVPDDDILTRCRELGKVVGGKLVEICRQRAG